MRIPFRRVAILIGFLGVLGMSGPAAAADALVPRGPSREPVPYRYDATFLQRVPREFLEDAAACTLYAGISHLVEADGTIETIVHDITRFNGRKAIEQLGEYRSIQYDPTCEKLTLNEARVHKADGAIVPIGPRHLQLRDLGTDFQVYETGKQLVISFPSLEVGDVIEVKWTTRGKNPEHHGHFFTRYNFGDDRYPVVLDEFRVRLPRDRPLTWTSLGGKLEPVIADDGTHRRYTWYATDRRQMPQDDDLPPREEFRLQVVCSTFASWDEVFRWKSKLRADCWQCTPEIRRIVQDVTRGLKTPAARARALTYWVRRHIRYVSVGDRHDYTPHRPADVLANRYGDCKDQSQLLAVMLREAGVPVGLATLGTRGDGQVLPQVPSPWGTHAILLVSVDGQDYWIDTTVSLAAWDFLPHDDRDRLCYVVDDRGLRLVRTPALTPDDNRIEQTTLIAIEVDGTSRCERSATYRGLAALSRRDDWMDTPVGERRRIVTSELQDANSRTRLDRLLLDETRLHDHDQPVTARIDFEIPGHFSGDPEREGSLTDSAVWGKILSHQLDYDRTVPLELWAPFESVHRFTIRLPPSHRFEGIPSSKLVRSRWGSFRLDVMHDADQPRHLQVEFQTRLEKVRVSPEDFGEFRRFHERLLKAYRVWLTLRPTHVLADAPTLEAMLTMAPEDTALAIALARLYVYHNRLADAQRVVRKARERQPGDEVLAELAVKTATTPADREAIHRDLVRRFPEEPKYALVLGQVLVDRDLQAEARRVLEPLSKNGSASLRAAAHFQLARSLAREGRLEDALKQLDDADPDELEEADQAASDRLRGSILDQLHRFPEALAAYRSALQREPQHAKTLAAVVRLFLAHKSGAEALDHLRRYTLAVENDPEGLVRAADFHLRMGRLEDAQELAERAGRASPHAGDRILGRVAFQRRDHEQAVAFLSPRVRPPLPAEQGRGELDGPALEALIRSCLATGRLRQAEEQAARADKVKQPTRELAQACDATITLVRRRAAVLETLKPSPEQAPTLGPLVDHLVCAEYAFAQGQPLDRVESLLSRALPSGVELGPALGFRSRLAVERGRLGQALADAETAIRLAPREAAGWYSRGRVRLEREQPDAVADLRQAAALSQENDARILHWLATALFHAGNRTEAEAILIRAVRLKPDEPDLREQLERFRKALRKDEGGRM